MIDIDQTPIGRTPKEQPGDLYGSFHAHTRPLQPAARGKGARVRTGQIQLQRKGGRCEACAGDGLIKVEMHFLPDVYVTCDECRGERYNRDTLEVRYRGKNIAECLDMSVLDGLSFLKTSLR